VDIRQGRGVVGAHFEDATASNDGSGYLLHGLEDGVPTPNGYLDGRDDPAPGGAA